MSFVRVLLTPEKAREATAAKKAAPACAFTEMMGAAGHCSEGALRLPNPKSNGRELGNIEIYNLIIDGMSSAGLGVKTQAEADSGLE